MRVIKKEGRLKRFKNIKHRNKEQLEVIKNHGENIYI